MVNNLIKSLRNISKVEFNARISNSLNGNVLGDHGRMRRVLFNVLQNAAFEARAGSVIEVILNTKPLAIDETDQVRVDILDFSMLLVCIINYEHHAQAPRTQLADLNMNQVFAEES